MQGSINPAKMMKAMKEDPAVIDQLLYPGKQLGNYNVDELKIDILHSGFKSLDDMMIFKKGRGELIFIGARPSQGKSALLVQLATNIAETGKSHLITLEDSHESIVTRQTARILNRGMDFIQRGHVPRQDLVYAQEQIQRLDMVVDDTGGLNVYQICDRARMHHKKSPLTALFIDYIQIVKSERKVSRVEDLAAISAELKALAKELKIPVIVASQLNRQSEFQGKDGKGRLPQLSDLRDSGSLEQDADVALLIHRKGEMADIIIAKNKNGPTGSVSMKYAGAQCRFIDTKVGYSELD